jgi:hypothetical protein
VILGRYKATSLFSCTILRQRPRLHLCRQVSAALLQKHGVQPSRQSAAELAAAEDSNDEQDGSSAEEADSGSEGEAGSSKDESDSDADPAAAAEDDLPAATAAPSAAGAAGRRAAGRGAAAVADGRPLAAQQSTPDPGAGLQGGADGPAALGAQQRAGAEAPLAAEQPARRQVSRRHAWDADLHTTKVNITAETLEPPACLARRLSHPSDHPTAA